MTIIKDPAKIASGISNPDGVIKIEMTTEQVMNWYEFLLDEEPSIVGAKRITTRMRCDIHDMYCYGFTFREISEKTGISKAGIRNIISDKKYNKLLSRVHATAIRLGYENEKTWAYGDKLCL